MHSTRERSRLSPSSANAKRVAPSVRAVFGFQTALEIHRSITDPSLKGPRRFSPPPGDCARERHLHTCSARIPRTALSDAALESLVAQLRERHPHLAFSQPAHLLVSGGRRHSTPAAVAHSCASPIPIRALLRLSEEAAIASPNLALCQLASTKMSFIGLLLMLWEACGTYCTRRTGLRADEDPLFDAKPLTSTRSLKAFCARNSHLRGSRKVERCLKYVADGSASPRETQLALLFGLPERYGGWNLGIPRMNQEIAASEKAFAIAGRRSFRCDLCWQEARLDVEYQSDQEHQGEAMRISDSRRANALASMGWTVIGITNSEATGLSSLATIANSIRKKLGKRVRKNVGDLSDRRLELCQNLGLVPFW